MSELKIMKSPSDNQFVIERKKYDGPEDMDRNYFCVSGYFGEYGPYVFRAAPALLEALELLRDYGCPACSKHIGASECRMASCPMAVADAAIAAAKGGE